MRARYGIGHVKLTVLYGAWKMRGGEVRPFNRSLLGWGEKKLTASTRIQLTVWAKLDTVDGAMVTLQNFALFTIYRMHADPLIRKTTSNKSILQDGMDRGGGWRIGQCDTVSRWTARSGGDEGDGFAGSDYKPTRLRGEFHGGNCGGESYACGHSRGPEVPPPEIGGRLLDRTKEKGGYGLDMAILSGGYDNIFNYPDDTLYGSLMSQGVGVFQKIWRSIGPGDVKNPGLFLLATGKEMRGVG